MDPLWQDFLTTVQPSLDPDLTPLATQNCMAPLSQLGLLKLAGPDNKTFLQGQVTCDVNEINPTQTRLGGQCNLKGRLLNIFRAWQMGTDLCLTLPRSMVSSSLQNLKKFALFSKVTLEDVSDQLFMLGATGPQVPQILGEIFKHPITAEINDCLTLLLAEQSFTIIKIPGFYPRYEIISSAQNIIHLWQLLTPHCQALTPLCWELLDIQAGLPTIYPETIDTILPHHAYLSLLGGISYKKGCYVGQEIIARMHYRGKIKKHLYRAAVKSELMPLPGSLVVVAAQTENDAPGLVIRASAISDDNYELLIIIDEQSNDCTNVHLSNSAGPTLRFLALPYTIPDHK